MAGLGCMLLTRAAMRKDGSFFWLKVSVPHGKSWAWFPPLRFKRDLRENHCCWSWILISGHTEAQTSPCLWNHLHSVRNTSVSTQTMGWSWLESVGYISASLLTLVISLVIDTKEGSFLGKVHHHNLLQHKGRLGLSASHWLSKNMVLLSLAILVYTHNGLSPFSSWGRSQNHRLYWVGRDVKGHLVPCWVVCLVVKGVRSPVHSGWRQNFPQFVCMVVEDWKQLSACTSIPSSQSYEVTPKIGMSPDSQSVIQISAAEKGKNANLK